MANIVRVPAKSGFDAVSNQAVPAGITVSGEAMEQCQNVEIHPDGKAYKYTGAFPLAGVNLKTGISGANIPMSIARLTGRFYPGVDVIPGKVYFAATGGEISDTATAQDAFGAFIGVGVVGLGNTVTGTALEIIKLGKMT
jgi:hypothetical protein